MSQPNQILKLVNEIAPERICRFLEVRGFVEESVGQLPGRLFTGPTDQFVVPYRNSTDYARIVARICEAFADENMTIIDIILQLHLPVCDLLRYRIEDPLVVSGSVPMGDMARCLSALDDMVRYTAAVAITGKAFYTNVPPDAKKLTRGCRFGQTELGSFVVKIFCPLKPSGLPVREHEEAIGRTVALACVENLLFLSSERADDPDVPLPAAMTRQVSHAVERLQFGSDFGGADFTVVLNPAIPQTPAIHRATLNKFAFLRAASITSRLKKALELEEESMDGFITDLHKDRPQMEGHISREITIDVKVDSGRRRKIRLSLLPKEYKRAVEWHDADREVQLRGVIDKRQHSWHVSKLLEFAPKNRIQGELF